MALVFYDRVQQTGTANTTVSFTLSGSVTGFQSFAVVGNGNTTYYGAYDTAGNWEVGLGTYSTTGPTLTRGAIYSSSNAGSAVTFSGTVNIFVTYISERAIIGDTNNNISFNNSSPGYTPVTTAGTTTTLTATSTYIQNFKGTSTQTVKLPDETTIPTGTAYIINNNSTGNVTIQDSGGNTLATGVTGAAEYFYSTSNGSATGGWVGYAFLPNNVQWGSGALPAAYGGTGVNNGSNTITLAGNVTYSGAFTQTFTVTAATNVTLPAGTSSNYLISSATQLATNPVSGTPSSSTYLRGDGTWATVSSNNTIPLAFSWFTSR